MSPKKHIDFNTSDNESESSHESEFDLKKEIEVLISQRISMPSSNSKSVIMSLERIQKHLFEKNNIYKVNIEISYSLEFEIFNLYVEFVL
jgi:hypothetical protein